jgi:hypothetical protein
LGFALRHEDLDLLVLKRLFEAAPQDTVTAFVRRPPMRQRRVSPICWTTAFISQRHRGSPVVTRYAISCSARRPSGIRRTQALIEFGARALGIKANEVIGRTGANVVTRAASFLLLADSRASFEIEGEKPPRGRLERRGRAMLQAGKNPSDD